LAENVSQSVDTVENAGPGLVEPVDNTARAVVRGGGPCYHRHASQERKTASTTLKCAARHHICAVHPQPGRVLQFLWPAPTAPCCSPLASGRTFHRLRLSSTYFHSLRRDLSNKRPLQAARLALPGCSRRPPFPTDVEEPVDKPEKALSEGRRCSCRRDRSQGRRVPAGLSRVPSVIAYVDVAVDKPPPLESQ
jgi:hypothetical protein